MAQTIYQNNKECFIKVMKCTNFIIGAIACKIKKEKIVRGKDYEINVIKVMPGKFHKNPPNKKN
jgi:hypothetical protein